MRTNTHTHTHTHSHAYTQEFCVFYSHTNKHTRTHAHTHTRTHTQTLSLLHTLKHAHMHAYSVFHTHIYTHTHTRTYTLSLSHTHTHTYTHFSFPTCAYCYSHFSPCTQTHFQTINFNNRFLWKEKRKWKRDFFKKYLKYFSRCKKRIPGGGKFLQWNQSYIRRFNSNNAWHWKGWGSTKCHMNIFGLYKSQF